jgi:cytidylate kinase
VQKAIRSACQAGNVVLVGRGGQAGLKSESDVFHVRIIASLEDRIQRVKERLKAEKGSYPGDITVRREAQDLIDARDAASEDYLRRFYDIDLTDVSNYHLVINTSKLSLEEAVDLIVHAVQQFDRKRKSGEENYPDIESAKMELA